MALLRPQPLPDPQRDSERVEPPAGRRLRGDEVPDVRRPAGRGTDPSDPSDLSDLQVFEALCLTGLTFDLLRGSWGSGCRVLKVRGFLSTCPRCLWSSTSSLPSYT